MPLQLFFNDLSLATEALSRAEAVSLLKGIVAVARSARDICGEVILNCDRSINSLPLGGQTTVAAVRNAGDCVTETQFLKTLQDRTPLRQVLGNPGSPDASAIEYKLPADAPILANAGAEALGLSHLVNGLAISMPTHAHWESAHVPLDRLELLEDETFQTLKVTARNACTSDDVVLHAEALRELTLPQFQSGAELWDSREVLLPHLQFAPRTGDQIEGLLAGDPVLEPVWVKLSGIDRAVGAWRRTGSARPVFPFNVRPESRSRMGSVEFNDAAGVTRVFSEHTDFAPGEGRIHFIVEPEPFRHALIGHVGRKLGIG